MCKRQGDRDLFFVGLVSSEASFEPIVIKPVGHGGFSGLSVTPETYNYIAESEVLLFVHTAVNDMQSRGLERTGCLVHQCCIDATGLKNAGSALLNRRNCKLLATLRIEVMYFR